MEKISENITYREAVQSSIAQQNGIDNIPNEQQLANMKILAEKVFEPLREELGGFQIHISSFFRCKDLNSTIGGASNSQHMALKGAAIDIDNDNNPMGPYNAEIFMFIKENLVFDQLIWEYGDSFSPEWVHVSYNIDRNRGQVLRCLAGKYIAW
jgi:hypothetical protein